MCRIYATAGKGRPTSIQKAKGSQTLRLKIIISALFALAITACGPMVGELKTGPGADNAMATRALAPQPVPGNQPAARSPGPDSQKLQLQDLLAREESGQTVIVLKFSRPITQYRHFPLNSPSRIIFDIFSEAALPSDMDSFRVGTNLVGTIRLSAAQSSFRVTIELTSSDIPVYTVVAEDGSVKIAIGGADPRIKTNRELILVRAGKRLDSVTAQVKKAAVESNPPASTTATTPAEEKKYSSQKLSFDFKDADIKNIFRLLAEVSGLNIVVTGDVNRKVTLRLVEVPWDQAMDLLIDTNGLGKEQLGNVVRISTTGQLKTEREALVAAKKAEENLEPLQTVYFNVNYAKVKDLEAKIKTVLSKRPDASVVVDERSNIIMIRDIKKAIEDASTLVARLDARTAQILIESNLIETTPTFARALGLRLQFTPSGGGTGNQTTFSSAQGAGSPFAGNTAPFPAFPGGFGGTVSVIQNALGGIRNLSATLEAAEQEGNIRIISRPSVVTLNNIASTIRSERILRISLPTSTNIASGSGSSAAGAAVATEKIPVGIILTVTPQVSADGYVLMNINVKSSSIANSATVPAVSGVTTGVVPFDELNREAVANVLVKDGETIVLGGILKDTGVESAGGIPYLKEIPIFGWLFKNHRVQKDFEELMVFITPRITDTGAANLPAAEQLWRDQMKTTYGNPGTPSPVNP